MTDKKCRYTAVRIEQQSSEAAARDSEKLDMLATNGIRSCCLSPFDSVVRATESTLFDDMRSAQNNLGLLLVLSLKHRC